jgi:hypothetical protein
MDNVNLYRCNMHLDINVYVRGLMLLFISLRLKFALKFTLKFILKCSFTFTKEHFLLNQGRSICTDALQP